MRTGSGGGQNSLFEFVVGWQAPADVLRHLVENEADRRPRAIPALDLKLRANHSRALAHALQAIRIATDRFRDVEAASVIMNFELEMVVNATENYLRVRGTSVPANGGHGEGVDI